ncbi:MAG TPA: ATP-binding protein, partial [Streptomyces sp.]
MRIAPVGKGTAPTTLSPLFIRHLAARGPVVAIDADIDQHLGSARGAT